VAYATGYMVSPLRGWGKIELSLVRVPGAEAPGCIRLPLRGWGTLGREMFSVIINRRYAAEASLYWGFRDRGLEAHGYRRSPLTRLVVGIAHPTITENGVCLLLIGA
jgi:hypothetical protein